eukprot:1600146-Pyramimonas_sp.AAC.1
MIGNPAIVGGVEYSVTLSIGNLLACCQANATVQNMKYGSFLAEHEIHFTFIEPVSRKAYRR